MTGDETHTSESIWTRQFVVPPWVRRVATILDRAMKVVSLVFVVLFVSALLYNRLTLGPGARLELTDAVSVRVPSRFTAWEYRDSGPTAALKSYVIGDLQDDHAGHIVVDALKPGEPPGFRDPALLAASARKVGKEVAGPARFSHSGFDVVATVEPTVSRAQHEGTRTLYALVDVDGQLVHITGDNVTLGTPEAAGPQAMAEAAIDLLKLSVR